MFFLLWASQDPGLKINFFVREPDGDLWEKSGSQIAIVNFGRQHTLYMILHVTLHAVRVTILLKS